jgi:hypothetical protein
MWPKRGSFQSFWNSIPFRCSTAIAFLTSFELPTADPAQNNFVWSQQHQCNEVENCPSRQPSDAAGFSEIADAPGLQCEVFLLNKYRGLYSIPHN